MKKLFTLAVLIVSTLSSFAFNTGKLTISTLNNYSITVVIDGRTQYRVRGENQYTFNDLTPGYHTVKIYRQQRSNPRDRTSAQKILYTGSVYIRKGYHIDIVINRFGKAFKDEQMINSRYNDNWNDDWNDDRWDDDHWEDDRWEDRRNDRRNDRRDDRNRMREMSDADFSRLKLTLSNESFDETRMNMAKQATMNNMFTASQVKQVMDLFSFETTKLDLAKYFYEYTTDRQNYIVVFDALSFSSSKDELTKYIRAFK